MMKRYLIGLPLFLLGCGVCLFLLQSCKNETVNQKIKFVRAKRGDLTQKIAETGIVNVLNQIDIKSKIGGKVAAIYAKEGTYVRRGEKLLHLDDEDTSSRLNQAKANLERSQAEIEQANISLEYARTNLESCQTLFKNGLIAGYELEQARKDYNLAKTQLCIARSEGRYHQKAYSTTLRERENTTIKAPISGVIMKKLVEEKEIIVPISQILFLIGDLSRMVIRTEINEIDINKIKVGQLAAIKFDAIANRSYQGAVTKIAPVGKTQGNVVTYEVPIEILDPDNQIKPGMSCDVDLIIERAENAIYLPIDSVRKIRGKSFVFIKRGKKFSWKEVIPGIANDNYVVIKEGVKEGEEVVHPSYATWQRKGQPERKLTKNFK